MRRRVIQLAGGERLFVDLAEPVALDHRDILVLDDGRHAEIIAAEETLYEVRGDDARHLTELAWHIGNRHLPAAIEPGRLLIRRDPVIRTMLEGLGAVIAETREIFNRRVAPMVAATQHTAVPAIRTPSPQLKVRRSGAAAPACLDLAQLPHRRLQLQPRAGAGRA